MFESGEGQQHAKRSDSGELDAGAEVEKTYGFQLPEDEPGQVGNMIYMCANDDHVCVNVCVCVNDDHDLYVCKCVSWWMRMKLK